jgi:hypothetical protein
MPGERTFDARPAESRDGDRSSRFALPPSTRTGMVSSTGDPDANTLSFRRRISHSKKLDPVRYTLVATAVSAARQRSDPSRLGPTSPKQRSRQGEDRPLTSSAL